MSPEPADPTQPPADDSADESGAPWPYDEVDVLAELTSLPSWECPGGLCACHPPAGEDERMEHRLTLFDHTASRMPGARCRVLEDGRLVNAGAPYADASGTVTVRIRPRTRLLQVEWAPAELPAGARFPFRRAYFVDLGRDAPEGVRRRLHNIGFSAHAELRADIADFQRTYHQPPTGEVADVDQQLQIYHDAAALPPVPPGAVDGSAEAAAGARAELDSGAAAAPLLATGGPSPSGSVAALQTTKVRIQLHRAFALFDDDFEPVDDVEWPDHSEGETIDEPHQFHRYDPPGLLRTLYPSESKRSWRLGGGSEDSHPIAGATLTFDSLGLPRSVHTTDAKGAVVIQLPVTGSPHHITLRVEPPPGQLNTTNKPAGPGISDKSTAAPALYRPFSLHLKVDDSGALLVDDVVIIPAVRPRFAKLIDASNTARTGNRIRIDWRPDWMVSSKRKRAAARLLDPEDTPVNPFDDAIPVEDRRATAPPGIVIHQTATHNLPFVFAFLGDGQVTNAHYVVDFDGFVLKIVDEYFKTNHAGASAWGQKVSVNQFTVGIETMHTDTIPLAPPLGSTVHVRQRRFLKEQYDALIRLCSELRAAYPIDRVHVIGHMEERIVEASEKAQGVKSRIIDGTLSRDRVGCPGDYFEWERLEAAGVALRRRFFPPTPPTFGPLKGFHSVLFRLLLTQVEIPLRSRSEEVRILKTLLFDIGYSVSKTFVLREELSDGFDTAMFEAVRAFQTRHFSGRRRRYRLTGVIGAEESFPIAGTLDAETIRAIVEVWWALENEP